MATWHELSSFSLRTAKRLIEEREDAYARSSISRSYYAAYSAIVGALPRGVTFGRGRRNPSHEQIAALIHRILPRIDVSTRRKLVEYIKFLRRVRETADYRPGHTVDLGLALQCLRRAMYIAKQMGVDGP